MAGGAHDDEAIVEQAAVNVLADGKRGDGIVRALQHEAPRADARQVVGQERHPRNSRAIASARQKLSVSSVASPGRSGLPMLTGAIARDKAT